VNEVNTKEVESRLLIITKLLRRLITMPVGRFLPGDVTDFLPATIRQKIFNNFCFGNIAYWAIVKGSISEST
jgi:hypothetical protein